MKTRFASKSARTPGKTIQNPARPDPCGIVIANGTRCEPAQTKGVVTEGHLDVHHSYRGHTVWGKTYQTLQIMQGHHGHMFCITAVVAFGRLGLPVLFGIIVLESEWFAVYKGCCDCSSAVVVFVRRRPALFGVALILFAVYILWIIQGCCCHYRLGAQALLSVSPTFWFAVCRKIFGCFRDCRLRTSHITNHILLWPPVTPCSSCHSTYFTQPKLQKPDSTQLTARSCHSIVSLNSPSLSHTNDSYHLTRISYHSTHSSYLTRSNDPTLITHSIHSTHLTHTSPRHTHTYHLAQCKFVHPNPPLSFSPATHPHFAYPWLTIWENCIL